jgi:hypothetical protein
MHAFLAQNATDSAATLPHHANVVELSGSWLPSCDLGEAKSS